MVTDSHVPAILPRKPLNLCVGEVADLHAAPLTFRAIFDRCGLNPEDFADERHQTCQMTACLAREDLSQSILLTLVCPFIHVESAFPFNLQHVAGRMNRKYGLESIQICLLSA